MLDAWRLVPRFYDLATTDNYGALPKTCSCRSPPRCDLDMGTQGNTNCWADSGGDSRRPERALRMDAVLGRAPIDGRRPITAAYLVNYSDQQRGRALRAPANVRLRNVMELMAFNRWCPATCACSCGWRSAFLLVCLVNTVGLLLASSCAAAARSACAALGALAPRDLQAVPGKPGTVGVAGGVLGLLLALLGLRAVRRSRRATPNWPISTASMLLLTFALAAAASLIAGLLPAWPMQIARGAAASDALTPAIAQRGAGGIDRKNTPPPLRLRRKGGVIPFPGAFHEIP